VEVLGRNNVKEKSLKNISNLKIGPLESYPEKVIQFGEGNFLRGFVDWMFNRLNSKGLFNGSVAVIQPINGGLIDVINSQDGLYTLILRGIQNGEVVNNWEVITAISRGIDLNSNFEEFLKLAQNPELRVVVSNTTEAGIAYSPDDKPDDTPPGSFPGKLTVFLYHRFKAFDGDMSKGFIIMPCELIDRNGDNLKKIVLRLAKEWKLGERFEEWIEKANYFLNTLVDRIVTGYPKDEIEDITNMLGYRDNLVDTGEIFHLWVIEGDKKLERELPFREAGLNVLWTDNMEPYRTRKVRILNGAHTMTVLAAYLYGLDTVQECIDDSIVNAYMKKGIYEEIIPTLNLPEDELLQYAKDVLERFLNPFIKHYLLSISLNSVSKFKTRVLPSLLEYVKLRDELPKILTFSLAALFAFYKGDAVHEGALIGNRNGNEYKIIDDLSVLNTFLDIWNQWDGSKAELEAICLKLLGKEEWWECDLNSIAGLREKVSNYLFDIMTKGIENVLKDVISES